MDRLPIPVFLGFPCGSAGKESSCNEGDLGSNPGLGRSPGEGKGYPLQYSGLENSMDCIVQGAAESDTAERLSLSLKWKMVFSDHNLSARSTHCYWIGLKLFFQSNMLFEMESLSHLIKTPNSKTN